MRTKAFLILLLTALLLLSYALSPWTLELGGVSLRKITLPDTCHSSLATRHTSLDSCHSSLVTRHSSPDTAAQRILFFGDSMLEGLSRRFGDYAAQNGHELDVVLWYSSTTERWVTSDTLAHFLRRYDPTFVVICLGSNELFVRDLPERDRHIGRILSRIGRRPYVWISPPNWKEDTGINDLILRHVGKERYFDSRHLQLQRGRDHAHPTLSAAATWMDSVAAWMSSPATAHPIRLERPDTTARPTNLTLLAPE